MKKIILPGLLAGLVMLAVSLLTMPAWNIVFPSLQSEYQNAALFRPWSDPLMQMFFGHPFLVGLILAWIWSKTKEVIKEKDYKKGVIFGFAYWILGIPGMFITYSSFPISFPMVTSWTITGLAQALLAGLILSKTAK